MKDEKATPNDSQKSYRLKGKRSANYPSTSLKVAIEKVAVLYKDAQTHLVPMEFVAKTWKYAVKSSGFIKLVAALGAYGLIDFHGTGEKKQIQVSKAGERIVEKGPEWEEFLKKAALQPKPFKKMVDKFATKEGRLPSKEILIEKLKWDDDFQFNKEVIGRVVSTFMETIDYAKLTNDAIMPTENGEEEEEKATLDHEKPFQVGDHVQWTINGMDQFNPPAQIKGFSPNGNFAFFDPALTKAGAPITQLTKCEPPNESQQTPKPDKNYLGSQLGKLMPPQTGTQAMKQYSIPVGGGADAVLFVPQPMTAKMYGKLKAVIDLYEDVLVENEDAQAQGSSSPTPDDDQKE